MLALQYCGAVTSACVGSTGPQALFYSPEERGCITVTNTLLSKQLLFDTCRHPPALQCQFYVFLMLPFKLLVSQNEHEKMPPTYLVLYEGEKVPTVQWLTTI